MFIASYIQIIDEFEVYAARPHVFLGSRSNRGQNGFNPNPEGFGKAELPNTGRTRLG